MDTDEVVVQPSQAQIACFDEWLLRDDSNPQLTSNVLPPIGLLSAWKKPHKAHVTQPFSPHTWLSFHVQPLQQPLKSDLWEVKGDPWSLIQQACRIDASHTRIGHDRMEHRDRNYVISCRVSSVSRLLIFESFIDLTERGACWALRENETRAADSIVSNSVPTILKDICAGSTIDQDLVDPDGYRVGNGLLGVSGTMPPGFVSAGNSVPGVLLT